VKPEAAKYFYPEDDHLKIVHCNVFDALSDREPAFTTAGAAAPS
jgi:hypothetical protein